MSYFDGIGMNAANPLGGTDGDKIAFVNLHRHYTNNSSGHETGYTPVFTAGYGIDEDSSTKSRLPPTGSGTGESGSDALDYIAHAKFSKLSLVSEIKGLSSTDMNDSNRATADKANESIFKNDDDSIASTTAETKCVLTVNDEGLVYAVPNSEIATPFTGELAGNLTVNGQYISSIIDNKKWIIHNDTSNAEDELRFRYYADATQSANSVPFKIGASGALTCTGIFAALGDIKLGSTTSDTVHIPGTLYISGGVSGTSGTSKCVIGAGGHIVTDGGFQCSTNGGSSDPKFTISSVHGSFSSSDGKLFTTSNGDLTLQGAITLRNIDDSVDPAVTNNWKIYQTSNENISFQFNSEEKLSVRDEGALVVPRGLVESGLEGSVNGGLKLYAQNPWMADSTPIEFKNFKVGVYDYTLSTGFGNFSYTSLGFYEGSDIKGYINTNGPYTDATFTGQHRCISETILNITNKIGYIVSATNKYKHLNSNSKNKIKNILINESVPEVSLTSKQKDKKVFGVISSEEDKEKETREHSTGAFVSVINKNSDDNRLYINSLGEGAIWVSDINGSIENGDYITSADIPGIGMKQDAEMLMNYTVAKITMDCNFNPVMEQSMVYNKDTEQYEPEKNENGHNIMLPEYEMKYIKLDGTIINKVDYELLKGQGQPVYKMAFVGCSYHCG